MAKINIERLQRIADKLLGRGPYSEIGPVQPKRFDLTSWFSDPKGTYLWRSPRIAFKNKECGTAACAIGHAVEDLWFIRQGFTRAGWGGSRQFFGCTITQITHLFDPISYQSNRTQPRTVGNRILRFIEIHAEEGMNS